MVKALCGLVQTGFLFLASGNATATATADSSLSMWAGSEQGVASELQITCSCFGDSEAAGVGPRKLNAIGTKGTGGIGELGSLLRLPCAEPTRMQLPYCACGHETTVITHMRATT